MPYVAAFVIVLCAAFSGTILGAFRFGSEHSGLFAGHFVNIFWGLYYGIGFEPALLWYKLYGPYRYGFVDLFGLMIWPAISSIFLYIVIVRLLSIRSDSLRSKAIIALALSFILLMPVPPLSPTESLFLPLYPNCAVFSMPF